MAGYNLIRGFHWGNLFSKILTKALTDIKVFQGFIHALLSLIMEELMHSFVRSKIFLSEVDGLPRPTFSVFHQTCRVSIKAKLFNCVPAITAVLPSVQTGGG